MKTGMAGSGLALLSLVCHVPPARADAVLTWERERRERGDRRVPACQRQRPGGVAQVCAHAAIHDAANAIDRRSRAYAFRTDVTGLVSVDAAVAAAAHDALVSVLTTLSESAECRANGIASVDASDASALAAIPDGAAKTSGVAVGQAAASAIVALRAGDGSDAPLLDPAYPQGNEPGEWRFTPDFPFPHDARRGPEVYGSRGRETVIFQLFAGSGRERGFSNLHRHSLPTCRRGRRPARTQDRRLCRGPTDETCSVVY